MEAREIKALHEAVYSHYHLLLQYSNRILDDMPDATMKANEIKVYTKAEDVQQAYDAAAWDDNIHSEGCYALAVAAAHELSISEANISTSDLLNSIHDEEF